MANNQAQPYQYGLNTNFGMMGSTPSSSYGPYGQGTFQNSGLNQGNYQGDPDEQAAAGLAQEMWQGQYGGNHGVDFNADQAALNMYIGRLNQKNALGQEISQNPQQMGMAQENLRQQANQAYGQGINKTRSNYNARGLLYSGLRQGDEAKVGNQVAGSLSAGEAGTTQDYTQATTSAQQAYASVDQANAAQNIQMATQAYQTATANNVARLQAMQQLGSGFGQVAGTVAGGMLSPGSQQFDYANDPIYGSQSAYANANAALGTQFSYGEQLPASNGWNFTDPSGTYNYGNSLPSPYAVPGGNYSPYGPISPQYNNSPVA